MLPFFLPGIQGPPPCRSELAREVCQLTAKKRGAEMTLSKTRKVLTPSRHKNARQSLSGVLIKIYTVAALHSSRDLIWPLSGWLSSASHFSKPAAIAGHSVPIMLYHVVSRFLPLTTICWRNTPSYVYPSRTAVRLDLALSLLHFHSRRRLPRAKAYLASW